MLVASIPGPETHPRPAFSGCSERPFPGLEIDLFHPSILAEKPFPVNGLERFTRLETAIRSGAVRPPQDTPTSAVRYDRSRKVTRARLVTIRAAQEVDR